eukprot:XP_001698107.1 alkane hydroxylase [Chlamydomonas reinhardtii]
MALQSRHGRATFLHAYWRERALRPCLRRPVLTVSAVAASSSAAEGRGKASGLGSLTFLDFVVPFSTPLAAAIATGVYTGAPGADHFLSRALPCLAVAVQLLVLLATYGALAAAAGAPAPPLAGAAGAAAAGLQQQQLLLLPLLVTSLALSAGMAQAASHELLHSRHPVHLAAAWLFLTTHWWYPYFRAHHQHHLAVCTPADYASAPRGLSLAAYLPRYIGSSYTEAWQLAAAECRRAGHPVFSTHNSCLVALVAQAALTAALGLALGPAAALLHGAVCAVLLTYMSVLDYVLHYGLRRPPLVVAAAAAATAGGVGGGADAAVSTVADSREVTGVAPAAAGVAAAPAAGSGAVRYAPVTPFNSWSSLYPLENALFFNVLIHGDHHMTASRSYAWLVPAPSSPTFPAPINALALATFVPPLWRAAMHERVDQANSANLRHLAATGVPVAAEQGAAEQGAAEQVAAEQVAAAGTA